ncbi:M1 family aminopeptidase [Rhodopirellula sp. P2]|uniref:M1 family aminopeptidase n=1 Tax=Rhodopirellula sp. P2 TaxID=2127060 RepID=UPI002367D0DE|nr:M1 family aminopeptidase [Rhodopirellula sp. P2]WDQ19359.1 M1 family aminopeptidase [Rhodopirellula sp. P2]
MRFRSILPSRLAAPCSNSGLTSAMVCLTVGLAWMLTAFACNSASAQPLPNPKHGDPTDKFHPLEPWLPTPNVYRTASGAPGPQYWQQRADYAIDIVLNDENQSLSGNCQITYHNQSPDTLDYLWVQLDQNRFKNDSVAITSQAAPGISSQATFKFVETMLAQQAFDGGYKISSVTDAKGDVIDHLIVDTMMRVDLDAPLPPGKSTQLNIEYSYNIVDAKMIRARGGYEFFEDDKNYIYEVAQWFPRMAAYTDYTGWQHHQFLGSGEFTLELGDYDVRIDVPADMVVASTGTLKNTNEVLKPEWKTRLAKMKKGEDPEFIITPEEAKANEKSKSKERATWNFTAKNVRDFAFAASRKFIWDAMPVKVGDQTVLAMSYYPNEAEPLWSQYSTESIAHTLEVYGRYSFEYPYEVAISVNGPVYGMEYPMICFNGPRPEDDGTYSKATKYGLISVIIHEVGHNFFPMIVNSDERQWTWMDEGLNTFLQYLTEQEWEDNYPSRRGPPEKIVPYMRGSNQRPIMTSSDEILQFGSNAYGKPATALNILRETVLGRERFDYAFSQYAKRWKFKRPTPSDFFRTIEDASGTDLDWFWRGWFYSTDHVDVSIEGVELYLIDSGDPDETAERKRKQKDAREDTVSDERNRALPLRRRIDWRPGLKDFYNAADYDEDKVEENDRKNYQKFLDKLSDEQRAMLRRTTRFYVIQFANKGGLVMPVPLRIHYADNTSEDVQLPPEIWRVNSQSVKRLFLTEKEIVRLEIDPKREIADTDGSNNHWPPKLEPSRFKLYQSGKSSNPMRKAAEQEKAEQKKKAEQEKKESQPKAEDSKQPADKPDADKSAEPKSKKPADKKPADRKSEDKKPADKKPEAKSSEASDE